MASAQGLINSTPSQAYYRGIEELYRGEYRDAERIFRSETRGAIKIGVTGRWVDSICYHAMWGEVLYHQGRFGPALEQFDQACTMFLQYPQWLLRVRFEQPPREDVSRLRRQQLPWGTSERQFTLGLFSSQMLISQGDLLSGNRAAQQGGVVQSAQLWRIDVIEVIRCTALAIRRRSELLGPLAAQDRISREMATRLNSGGAPPNHWSGAWIDLQQGLVSAGEGKSDLALKQLARAELIQGRFDHPLTCVALLEQGRIHMEQGNTSVAAKYFAEASYSAFYYDNPGIVDEAFKLGAANRLAGGIESVSAALDSVAAWARRERFDHIFARVSFALSEEQMTLGNWDAAAATIEVGQTRLRDARSGLLGSWSQFLAARIAAQQGRDTAPAALAAAIDQQLVMTPRNFQIGLANGRYDQQLLRDRSAADIYQSLLADPTPADWVFRPLETLSVLQTPHEAAFDRWLNALLSRNDLGTALEVTDLAKRRRFLGSLAWGGRLASLRDTLELPAHTLTPQIQVRRQDLLLKYPRYGEEQKAGQQLWASLKSRWLPALDEQSQSDLNKDWRAWSTSLQRREAMLNMIGLERVAVDPVFPPLSTAAELQAKLQPGQAVVVFHDTSNGLLGFLITAKGSTHWNCGPVGRLNKPLNDFLRSLGNYDASHDMTTKDLASDDWQATGKKLYRALFDGSSIDLESTDELIVVPDNLVWYVPLAALPAELEDRTAAMISLSKLRVVPTMGLAMGNAVVRRRVQRSGIVGRGIVPGDTEELQDESLTDLREAVLNPIALPTPSPIPTAQLASLLETLIVLDEIEIDPLRPLDWSPVPGGRAAQEDTLSHWLSLPQFGPQNILLPAVHTIAERGGRTSKRKASAAAPGHELFLASCGLMSTGAQTVLLSRWSVGGQSTLDLVREFIQELPHTTAADAWQRSVQVAMEMSIHPDAETRVKADLEAPPITAAHPFFWGGYLLIDAGAPAETDEAEPQDSPAEVAETKEAAVAAGEEAAETTEEERAEAGAEPEAEGP
ncbi:MAG: CHAT domain-containing protein [Planctomycetales bacterium]|nr:CHAT domain-containing protein [Planctomycetales bacterium]